MTGRRLLPLLLAAFVFVSQSGDCFGAILKSKESRDCCRKGKCSRQNTDPCCEVSSLLTVHQDQAKEKTPAVTPVVFVLLPSWVLPTLAYSEEVRFTPHFAPSPPGAHGSFNIPLLV